MRPRGRLAPISVAVAYLGSATHRGGMSGAVHAQGSHGEVRPAALGFSNPQIDTHPHRGLMHFVSRRPDSFAQSWYNLCKGAVWETLAVEPNPRHEPEAWGYEGMDSIAEDFFRRG
jgi:hypothetical protein